MFDHQRKRFGRAAWLRPWLTLAALFALFFSTSAAHAGGGIGTVWAGDVTENSITVNWDYPAKDYSSVSKFLVCIKFSGDATEACDEDPQLGWSRNYTTADGSARSYTITGLQPLSEYKIKIYAYGAHKIRKTWAGRFLKWATGWAASDSNKIGIAEAKTGAFNPTSLQASFWVSAVDSHHVQLSWRWFGPGGPSSNLHLCYKKRWALSGLKKCKNGNETNGPLEGDGAFQITDISATSVTLNGTSSPLRIDDSTNYIFYLVDGSTVYGEAKVTTPANPK